MYFLSALQLSSLLLLLSVPLKSYAAVLNFCGTTLDNFQSLDFNLSAPVRIINNPPFTFADSDNPDDLNGFVYDQFGDVYRFVGVGPSIDALVTIDYIEIGDGNSGAEHATLLADSGVSDLNGLMRSNTYGHFEYTVQLVDTGTFDLISPIDVFLTSTDIDGNSGNTVTDYGEFINASAYFRNGVTYLQEDLTSGNSAKYTVQTSALGVNDKSAPSSTGEYPKYVAGAIYLDTNTFKVKGGFENATKNTERVSFFLGTDLTGLFTNPQCTPGFTPPSADLSVVKELISSSPYTSGQPVTYTLTVFNAGPDTATNVVIQDLPTNLEVTSVTPTVSSCTISSAPSPSVLTTSVDCTITSLAKDASEVITIQAKAP
ncbi:DUF11 domain-containing protein [uncultured Cocleimonas sp.]|uniref:DUF11 domain-containing protein n=1 Tax=uncultured Cocleimonas sp. TaxID=1051587 RepID=UPI002622F66B|nr:DUF11 domain-containing protein [uncultured Cocleimonas sp.]